MYDFNHLENLCGFLDNVGKFNDVLFDETFPYDEDTGRQVFGEHIYNLLVERGADVDEDVAARITDALVGAFYRVPAEYYKESAALQKMLRAADAAIVKQCDRINTGDYTLDTFTITIGGTSAEFILGGPQLDALYAFAHYIADENGYSICQRGDEVAVEE